MLKYKTNELEKKEDLSLDAFNTGVDIFNQNSLGIFFNSTHKNVTYFFSNP